MTSVVRPLLVATLTLALAAEAAEASAKPRALDEAKATATRFSLWEDEQWLRLGHYRSRWFGGYKSEADGSDFFLADDGKFDPKAELFATLEGFYAGLPPAKAKTPHALCRFPARFLYLDQKLHLDKSELPKPSCEGFVDFWKLLNPASATLIFSSYYLNNPASAFGHTFLRINKQRPRFSTERPELLDYGIDYSARVDTGNFLIYAIKGIFGLFPGTYRRVPYYFKVREYNDYESRDLWEYELNLKPAELTLLVMHLWELGWTHFNYYYMDENCSYHILGAIEAAKPDAELLDDLSWPVVPVNTVKALFDNPGLVKSVHYRPSARTQFEERVEELSPTELEEFSKLVSDADAPVSNKLNVEQKVRVLDAALDLADSTYARELLKPDDERDVEVAEYKQRLLERRAEVLEPSEDFSISPPFRLMPHLGHGTQRAALGSGYEKDLGFYHAVAFRVALHDLVDPVQGYPETSQIDFLPIQFRYYLEAQKPWLEEALAIRIFSLSPWTRFSKPLSWTVRAGASRIRDDGCDRCLTGVAALGGGLTLDAFDGGALVFAMAELELRGLGPIRGGIADLPLRAGAGPFGGLRLRLTDDLLALFQGRWTYLPTQEPEYTWEADGAIRWQYAKNFALGAEGRYAPDSAFAQVFSYIYF